MAMRLLYVPTFTSSPTLEQDPPSSDSIGYGVTSAAAIVAELRSRNIEVITLNPRLPAHLDLRARRAHWTSRIYADIVSAFSTGPPDAIFIFHIFSTFPAVVRKAIQDLGADIPIVGYTHGSHWDPTDLYRFQRHPGLKFADLGNLEALDALFVASVYMRDVLVDNIKQVSPEVAAAIAAKIAVVGLPLDTSRIDRQKVSDRTRQLTIVYNHAPIESKRPDIFIEAAGRVLAAHDATVLFTRRFGPSDYAYAQLRRLVKRFPNQVVLGNDMDIDDYYGKLWEADIQVSTASHESFGVSTLEAMYTNNACLLPMCGSYPEICRNDSDVLYDIHEEDLATRIAHLIVHRGLREQVATRLTRVAQLYGARQVVDRIMETLQMVTCRQGGWRERA
jgi:glycosyltransferase involved in cell wall biosynthesis